MKKYTTPEIELLALAAMEDILVASDEHETPKDLVDNENLVITDIASI